MTINCVDVQARAGGLQRVSLHSEQFSAVIITMLRLWIFIYIIPIALKLCAILSSVHQRCDSLYCQAVLVSSQTAVKVTQNLYAFNFSLTRIAFIAKLQ